MKLLHIAAAAALTAALLPTAGVQSRAADDMPLLRADVNGDYLINSQDMVLLSKFLLGAGELSSEQAQRADFDGDGVVDTFDLISMRKSCVRNAVNDPQGTFSAVGGSGKRWFWFDGSSVDEIAFSEYVLYKHPMRCIHDRLYDIDGLLSDAAVQSEILEYVRPYVKSNVAKNVEKYLNALKLAAYCPELPIQEDRIHFQNGTYSAQAVAEVTYGSGISVSISITVSGPDSWNLPGGDQVIGYQLYANNLPVTEASADPEKTNGTRVFSLTTAVPRGTVVLGLCPIHAQTGLSAGETIVLSL